MFTKLLELSHEFLLITDQDGNCLEVGSHLRDVLTQQAVTIDVLTAHLRQQLPELLQSKNISLPLAQYGIHASTFSLLHQEDEQIVLIAEDQTLSHTLDTFKKQTEQAELRYREREERTNTLLDESSDPIFSFREDGTYLYVNKIFAHTVGYEQDDIIGAKIWDVFPQEEADKRFAMVKKVFYTGETDNIEVKIPLPDGDKYFLTTVKPIKDQCDRVSFIICISKDITDLRETQNRLKILQGMLPICSACKNIRNDKGSWQILEEYISYHSEAQFTHGICPDCAHKLYPDMY